MPSSYKHYYYKWKLNDWYYTNQRKQFITQEKKFISSIQIPLLTIWSVDLTSTSYNFFGPV